MQWTDEGIVIGVRRHGEASAILELMTRDAWPPSRAGARRLRLAHEAGPADRQYRERDLAGAARRASRQLHGRAAAPARVEFLRQPARDLWRQPSGGDDAAAARARSACRPLFGVRGDPRPARGSGAGGAAGGAFRIAAVVRARLRPRSRAMRLDRRARRSDLCLAEIGAGGLARGRRAVGRQDAAAAGLPARPRRAGRPAAISPTALRSPAFSWRATCWSRAGWRSPTSARISSRRSGGRCRAWRKENKDCDAADRAESFAVVVGRAGGRP